MAVDNLQVSGATAERVRTDLTAFPEGNVAGGGQTELVERKLFELTTGQVDGLFSNVLQTARGAQISCRSSNTWGLFTPPRGAVLSQRQIATAACSLETTVITCIHGNTHLSMVWKLLSDHVI